MIALLAALLVGTSGAAEVSFGDAVRQVSGTGARIVDAEATSARAEARAAGAWPNPTADVHRDSHDVTFELTIPIEAGAFARGAVTPHLVGAIDVRARAARAAVGAAGGAAWLDARRSMDIARFAADEERLAGRLSRVAAARVDAGEWSLDEGALVRADAARVLDRALSWEQEARNATARLAVLLGVSADDLTLGAWPAIPSPPTLDAARVPEVLAAALDARAALGSLHAERLARIPALELSGGYALSDHLDPIYGASVTIPLFAPGGAKLRGAAARAEGAAATAELAGLDAVAAVRAAEAEIAVATRLAAAWDIPGLDTALQATVRRYDAGELSLPDFIARRDLAVEARRNAIDARWRLERARLAVWELAGELPPEVAR